MKQGAKMKTLWFCICAILLFTSLTSRFTEASSSDPPVDCDRIRDRFGPDIARLYRTVECLPQFANVEPLPMVTYRKDKSPCNELFIQENPEMAEACRRTRETLTIENRFQKGVTVHRWEAKSGQ